MGLGLNLRVDGGRGLFRRKTTEALANELGCAVAQEASAAAPLLAPAVRLYQTPEGYELQLHPADEPLRLEVQGDTLAVSARTNGAGPGYHAFVVQVLERAAKRVGVKLHSGGEQSDYQDEARYFETRDFGVLQGHMLRWLASIAQHLEAEALDDVRVSMPLDAPSPLEQGAAMTPMGLRSREWMRDFLEAAEPRRRELAAGFFPWWEQGLTAHTCLNLGLHLAWAGLAWHPPADEAERVQLQLALDAFTRAASLGASVPEREVEELRALLAQQPAQARAPREEGIGYLRRTVRWHLAGGWSLELPGYWYAQTEEQGTWVAWWGERAVRLSAFRGKPGAPHGREVLLQQAPTRENRLAWLTREEPGLYATAQVAPEQEEGSAPAWVLTGETVVGRSLCLVTVTFPKAEDLGWAEGVWRSLRHPPEDPEAEEA